MPLKDKIKHMLHPSGHKKSTSTSSPPATASATAGKPDPNKPPNARDPGFRKSFNLGETEHAEANDSETTDTSASATTDPVSIQQSASQNVPTDGKKMYTLDKYGDDYLAVSPRTNATSSEATGVNRGLSTVSTLDDPAIAGLGVIRENRPGDQVSGAAKKLDELSTSQQNPDYGRDQFARGEKQGGGFIEPVPTRDSTITNTSPQPHHPTSFVPESAPPVTYNTAPTVDSNASPLLAPPKRPAAETASSIYSDDGAGRSNPQQISREEASSPPLNPTGPHNATAHQQQYTSLLSDVLAPSESAKLQSSLPNSSNAGETTTPGDGSAGTWSQSPISQISNTEAVTPEPKQDKFLAEAGMSTTAVAADSNFSVEGGKLVPERTLGDSEASIDREAEAFADILTSNFESLKLANRTQATRDAPEDIPDVLSPEEKPTFTTTNNVPHADAAHMGDNLVTEGKEEHPKQATEGTSQRPQLKPGESVLEVTKAMPGSFST